MEDINFTLYLIKSTEATLEASNEDLTKKILSHEVTPKAKLITYSRNNKGALTKYLQEVARLISIIPETIPTETYYQIVTIPGNYSDILKVFYYSTIKVIPKDSITVVNRLKHGSSSIENEVKLSYEILYDITSSAHYEERVAIIANHIRKRLDIKYTSISSIQYKEMQTYPRYENYEVIYRMLRERMYKKI